MGQLTVASIKLLSVLLSSSKSGGWGERKRIKNKSLLRNKTSSVLRNQLIRLYIFQIGLFFKFTLYFQRKNIFRNHLMANKKGQKWQEFHNMSYI